MRMQFGVLLRLQIDTECIFQMVFHYAVVGKYGNFLRLSQFVVCVMQLDSAKMSKGWKSRIVGSCRFPPLNLPSPHDYALKRGKVLLDAA
jgi:hypothetical protein